MKYKIIGTASVVFLLASFFASAQITFTTQQVHRATSQAHRATARISVQKYNTKPDCEAPCNHCSLRNSYLAAGEVEEQILAVTTLNVVAERLGLAAKWQVNGEELLSMLKEKIQVRQFLSTTGISITAISQDAVEAAAIANEVAQVFLDDVEEQNRRKKEIAQIAADKERKAQEELVEQLKQKLQTLRKEHGLPESLSVDDEAVQKLQMDALRRDRILTEKAMVAAEARWNKFSELKDKSMDEFASFVNDPFVDTLRDQIKQVEKKLSEKTPVLGADHPEVKEAQAVLAELNKKRKQAFEGLLRGLHAQYIVSKSKFDALNQEIEKVENAQPIIKSPELKRVRAEYETQKAALDVLREKAFMVQHIRPSCSAELVRRASVKNESPSEFRTAQVEKMMQAVGAEPQPKLYRSTSRISVLKRQDELLKCKAPCAHCLSKPSSSLQTETVMIKWSRPVLDEVAQRLDLIEKWAVNGIKPSLDEVSSLLKRKLSVQQVGDSSFIDITATSSDAAEAAAIANEVARAYKKHVEGIALKEKQRGEEALARELKKQDDKVQQAELKYKELRKKQGLPEIPVVLDKSQRQKLEEDLIEARVAMLVAKAKWEQLSKLETTSKETKNEAEKTYLEAKRKFETLDQKRKTISGKVENIETRRARRECDIQRSILAAVKRRIAENPAAEEKPPRCVVEIISLAHVEESSD